MIDSLLNWIRPEIRKNIDPLIDVFVNIAQQGPNFFRNDCGEKLEEFIKVSKGYYDKRFGKIITEDEAFDIFNIVSITYAEMCRDNNDR